LAYEQNTEVSVISKALGHTSSDTTFVYIKGIDDHRLDKANFRIAQQILDGKEKCGK
jgi:integrase